MQIVKFKTLFAAVCAAVLVAALADTSQAGLFDWLCHDDDECCYDPCCPPPACHAPPAYAASCCGPASYAPAYAPAPTCGCAAPARYGVGYHGYGHHGVGYRSRSPYGAGRSAFYPASVRGPRPYLYGY